MGTNIFLIIVWLVVVLALGPFATKLIVSTPSYKYLEGWFRAAAYLLAVVISLIIGLLL